MRSKLTLPRLYAILDAEALLARGADLLETAAALREAGVRLLQYRDKQGSSEVVLRNAQAIARCFRGSGCTLVLNDHAELVASAGWDGVHLGQDDARPEDARALVGEHRVIGLSTHTPAQAVAADRRDAVDYVAIGPVFATTSKRDPAAVVGLDGLREVRAHVLKPLVAIGGISRETLTDVLRAGADSAAVIGALFEGGGTVQQRARDLLSRSAR